MEYNYLGKSGLKISNICLGTMTFGRADGGDLVDTEKCHQVLDRFVELGGNFIDTANVYSTGVSEKIIGEWLVKQKREELVIATKVGGVMSKSSNNMGLGRKHILQSCEESLKRLQTDYIDLFQAHMWDYGTPIEETLEAFDELVRSGKVRYIGLSNACGWMLQKAIDVCQSKGYTSIISLQQQYSLLCRHSEFEEFQVCRNEGLGVLPWSPLKGGLLTGKFQRGKTPDKSSGRIGIIAQDESKAMQSAPAWSKYSENESYWKLIETMDSIAKSHGKTIAQVAIRWVLQKNVVPSVIIGASSVKQLEDNVGAGQGWKLSKEQMEQLDDLTTPDRPYPYEMIWRHSASRVNPSYSGPFVANIY